MSKDVNRDRAFPNKGDNSAGFQYYDGMLLRDYFAAKAMQGLLAHGVRRDFSLDDRDVQKIEVRLYYQMADAMLAEREKNES